MTEDQSRVNTTVKGNTNEMISSGPEMTRILELPPKKKSVEQILIECRWYIDVYVRGNIVEHIMASLPAAPMQFHTFTGWSNNIV